ncbi:MAG: hypothetical protein ACKVRP_02335 [Bacteroidota bacterium]
MDRISIVEDILIEALKEALPGVMIETRATQLTEEELKKLIGRAPFVLIEYGSGARRVRSEEGKSRTKVMTFNLYCGAKSLRDKKDSQRGNYSLLATVQGKLDGSTFNDTEDTTRRAGPFQYENDQLFADLSDGTVYMAVYSLVEVIA